MLTTGGALHSTAFQYFQLPSIALAFCMLTRIGQGEGLLWLKELSPVKTPWPEYLRNA